ncbi:MAG: RNA methyltransferase, partial [Bacteroidaceae bacterium]|nr:RNA methyltransferase [Bacteroidaceae bacterium]
MISKNRIKNIRSLALKKNRDALGFFVAEGPKVVEDLVSTFTCIYLAALPEWLQQATIPAHQHPEIDEISAQELQKISFLQHPQDVLAVFRKPETQEPATETLTHKLALALDDIQNPGNLGTIIRLADWFGITDIFCSLLTADAYGNKVIQ